MFAPSATIQPWRAMTAANGPPPPVATFRVASPMARRRNSGLGRVGIVNLVTASLRREINHSMAQGFVPIGAPQGDIGAVIERQGLIKPRQIAGLVDVHFAAGEGQRDQRARRLNQQRTRAFVAAERKEPWKDQARKYSGNAKYACIG